MRPQLLTQTLKDLINLNRAVLITGSPGGGKTSLVRQVAKDLDRHYIEQHLPTMLVEDFGVPYPDGDTLSYKLPKWYPAKGSQWDDGRGGVLCFDDRNQGDNNLQKVLANIIEARTLHGVPMADGWSVVSTGNRQQDRAGSNRVLSHLANRETMLPFDTHLDDWTAWALNNEVTPELVSFIRFRPNLLHDFDPQRDQNPTPRSWVSGVASVIGNVPSEAEYECFCGAVGEGAAAEFTGFLKIFRKLPNPDAVLLNPDSAQVPEDPATLYALSGALAHRASESNFDRLVRYLERLPKEFSVLTVSQAIKRNPDVTNSTAFVQWSVANQEVLF